MRRLPSANGLHRPRCSRHPYNSQDEVPNEPGGGAAAPDQRVLGRGGLLHDGLFTPRYRWVEILTLLWFLAFIDPPIYIYHTITFRPCSEILIWIFCYAVCKQLFLFTFLTNLAKFWDRCAKIPFEYIGNFYFQGLKYTKITQILSILVFNFSAS